VRVRAIAYWFEQVVAEFFKRREIDKKWRKLSFKL
jgi:hypothetical protein